MTDQIKGFTVVLDKNYRDDDIEAVKNAIFQIKGVLQVVSIGADHTDVFAEARVRRELSNKLWDVLNAKP